MSLEESVLVKTISGKNEVIRYADFLQAMADNDIQLFKMRVSAILEFRVQYLKRGGRLPITKERVKQLFERR